MFKVIHVHKFIIYAYIILYSFPSYICYLHVNCACNLIEMYDCICIFRLHNKAEYPLTKIFVLVNGMKECNIFFFSRASVTTNLIS